jgi:hypothetical protein
VLIGLLAPELAVRCKDNAYLVHDAPIVLEDPYVSETRLFICVWRLARAAQRRVQVLPPGDDAEPAQVPSRCIARLIQQRTMVDEVDDS